MRALRLRGRGRAGVLLHTLRDAHEPRRLTQNNVPTYEYECRSCGNRFDVIHPMSDPGPQSCELCGGPVRRVVHAAGIIFKGSGFYKTDSRRETESKPASASTSTATEPSTAPATDAPVSDAGSKAAEPTTGKTSKPDPA